MWAERVDVTECGEVRAFAEHVEERLGPASALVNNAAVLGPVGRIDQVDLGEWRRALEINVVGTAQVTAAFVPQMERAGGGSVVNLSGGGVGGSELQELVSAYTSAKGAVAVLTESLARELAPFGIRVNALAPGPLPTGFRGPANDVGADLRRDFPEVFELLGYLLSPESAWLSGRLLSARWDPVTQLRSRAGDVKPSQYTLRRIDDALFTAVEDQHSDK